jgi:hypothetical protein
VVVAHCPNPLDNEPKLLIEEAHHDQHLQKAKMMFIGTEEQQLTKAFGKVYEDYVARVDRLVPFKKP